MKSYPFKHVLIRISRTPGTARPSPAAVTGSIAGNYQFSLPRKNYVREFYIWNRRLKICEAAGVFFVELRIGVLEHYQDISDAEDLMCGAECDNTHAHIPGRLR